MLGHAPISFRPISLVYTLTIPAVSLAEDVDGQVLVYTVELFPSSGERLAVATAEFRTLSSDTLNDHQFHGTLDKPPTFTRSIIDGQDYGGTSYGVGEIEINNTGGDYDQLYLDETIDGRRLLVKSLWIYEPGDIPESYDRATQVLDCLALDWHLTDKVLRVLVEDFSLRLDAPASPNVYGGTGGLDGTADMAGKRKPRAWGVLAPSSGSGGNVTPPLVKPSTNIFQVNDGSVSSIPAVYDGGYALTATADHASLAALEAATVPNGSYATSLALGIFRLGSKPFREITCDVNGESTAGFVADTAGILRRWLTIAAPAVDLVDEASFSAVTVQQLAQVGFYLGLDDDATIGEVGNLLMRGIGGWGPSFRRDGALDVGMFLVPAGDPVDYHDQVDIVEETLERIVLPGSFNPPPKRIRVACCRNWTVQPQVIGGVTAARAQMLKEPWSVGESTNAVLTAEVIAAHPSAQDPEPVPAYFATMADAVVEANRLLTLKSGALRSSYKYRLKRKGLTLDIDDVISLTYPRFDLTAGKLMRVVAVHDDIPNRQTEVTVFG